MVQFFLKHPIIAIVLNTMLLVVGYLALEHLPLCEYPQVRIPEFTVYTHYHNGDVTYMEEIVTNAIEDKIMGLPGIEKLQSETHQGASQITVTFNEGINVDAAQMGLREAIAKANLPKEVPQAQIRRRGAKGEGVPFFLLLVESTSHSPQELTHYTNCILRNAFRGIDGVAEVNTIGSPYKMDIALDGKKMRQYSISPHKVFEHLEKILKNQPLGKIHDLYPIRLDQPLCSVEDFQKIMIPASKKQSVALGDFSTIDLKLDNGEFRFHVNGKPGIGLEIKESSTANPLDVSDQLHEKIAKLQETLPKDICLKVIIDQAEFIRSSLNQVRNSLIEAIICVMLVVGLFLGSFRLSLVPLVTIPLSLMGSLAVLMAFGYSINTLTLLGAVLATGLVVDDAIVVLENISRHKKDTKNIFDASYFGAKEVAFAVVAMTLTLASVYLPIAFQRDAMGQLFAEFAVSVSAAVIISGITAITLTPWMSMLALKNTKQHDTLKFTTWLETFFQKTQSRINLCSNWIFGAIFIGVVIGSLSLVPNIAKEIGPKEDRGIIGLWVPASPGISMDQKEQMAINLDKIGQDNKNIKDRISFIFNGGCSVCCMLMPHNKRPHSEEMYKNLQKDVDSNIPYTCYTWSVSTGLPGLNNDSNSDISLGIVSPAPLKQLHKTAEDAIQVVRNSKAFQNIRLDKTRNTTAQKCQLHPFLAEKFKLKREEILNNIEIVLSGRHHLQFFKDNQAYKIDLHTLAIDHDINRVFACNDDDKIFSLGSVVTITQEQILEPILHLNQRRLMLIKMAPKSETNVSAAKKQINKELRKTLTNQESFGWLDNDAMASTNSQMMMTLFVTALIFIYAILCIQFESFLDPLLILLTVPFASFGALLWLWASGQSLNIFSQISLITLIGLISKHGILLVEFANSAFKQTQNWQRAFEEAVTKRFLPIVMTTAAMVLGCIPLAIASGPGSEIRQAIAGVLISGLCFGTISTLFLLPRLATIVKNMYIKIKMAFKSEIKGEFIYFIGLFVC